MFFKSSHLILLVFGVYFVSGASIVNQPHPNDVAEVEKIESRFSRLKNRATHLFMTVKGHWSEISKEVGEGAHAVHEDYIKTKQKAHKLIDEAKHIYAHVKLTTKRNYESFHKVYADLHELLHGLKEHGGEAYKHFKQLLDEVKDDMADLKLFVKTGNFSILKHDFEKVKVKYDSFKLSFDKTLEKLIDNIKQTKQDSKILIDGVKKDVVEVVTETRQLLDETTHTFKEIIEEGKKSYEKFRGAYLKVKKLLVALRDGVIPEQTYEKINHALKVVNNFVQKHETLAKIVGEAGTIEEEIAAEAGLADALELLILL